MREPQDREQLLTILHEAQENNLLDADALAMMEGVMQVSEMQARDIMVPKADITFIEHDCDHETLISKVIESGHSRFPVIGEKSDQILGILLAKDLLKFTKKNYIAETLRPAMVVPESKRLEVLLKEFRTNHNHMSIVVDEYGTISGLVTMEDILEQIVGDIEDETDIEEEQYIEKINDNQYSISALTPIEDFNEEFGTNYPDDEFDTIGGLVLQNFTQIPTQGEKTSIDNFTYKIFKSDQRRIINLELTIKEKDTADD